MTSICQFVRLIACAFTSKNIHRIFEINIRYLGTYMTHKTIQMDIFSIMYFFTCLYFAKSNDNIDENGFK